MLFRSHGSYLPWEEGKDWMGKKAGRVFSLVDASPLPALCVNHNVRSIKDRSSSVTEMERCFLQLYPSVLSPQLTSD